MGEDCAGCPGVRDVGISWSKLGEEGDAGNTSWLGGVYFLKRPVKLFDELFDEGLGLGGWFDGGLCVGGVPAKEDTAVAGVKGADEEAADDGGVVAFIELRKALMTEASTTVDSGSKSVSCSEDGDAGWIGENGEPDGGDAYVGGTALKGDACPCPEKGEGRAVSTRVGCCCCSGREKRDGSFDMAAGVSCV